MTQGVLDRTTSTRPQGPGLGDRPDAEGFTHARVDVGEVTLHVASVAGSEQNGGPLVVFLHGFPEFWWSWRHQMKALAAAGYRVMAPDLRGYHLSDKPRGVASYKVESLADDVAGLIHASGAPDAVVVGHDWGAMVAWMFADRHADLLRRLVIMNVPHPRAMLRGLLRPEQLKKSWYMFFFQLDGIAERAAERRDFAHIRRMFRYEGLDAEETERLIDALRAPGALTAAMSYYRHAIRRVARGDVPAPTRIEQPVLVIWGDRDRHLGSEMAAPPAEWVPHARVEHLPDATHWVQQVAPERVNALLLEFLAPEGDARG
jgi:epoxide hydrolase 4